MGRITDSLLVWWLRTGRQAWSRLHRRLFERKYLAFPLPQVSSVEAVQGVLAQVTWTMDGPLYLFDCISYPQVTWTKKRDDCDGFASLAAALLKTLDPDPHAVLLTVGVHPVRNSHTVCVFRTPNGRAFFDNSSLRGGCREYGDVVALISQGAKRLVCWDVRDPSSLDVLEFHVA